MDAAPQASAKRANATTRPANAGSLNLGVFMTITLRRFRAFLLRFNQLTAPFYNGCLPADETPRQNTRPRCFRPLQGPWPRSTAMAPPGPRTAVLRVGGDVWGHPEDSSFSRTPGYRDLGRFDLDAGPGTPPTRKFRSTACDMAEFWASTVRLTLPPRVSSARAAESGLRCRAWIVRAPILRS